MQPISRERVDARQSIMRGGYVSFHDHDWIPSHDSVMFMDHLLEANIGKPDQEIIDLIQENKSRYCVSPASIGYGELYNNQINTIGDNVLCGFIMDHAIRHKYPMYRNPNLTPNVNTQYYGTNRDFIKLMRIRVTMA